MNAPFYKFGMFGDEMSLVVAFITGIAFGYFLEGAGFGNARVLAAQFYFRDLRVLKVMFTAIITALLGSYLLARFGMLDLSLVYLTPTLVVPQIIGGLLLGAGFIIGGYCPGTSCVSAATGRVDGMVYIVGMVAGIFGYGEFYPHFADFTKITNLGKVTLASQFNISYGLLVFAVVVMAIVAFVAAEWAEGIIGKRTPDADSLLAPAKKLSTVRKAAVVFLVLGLIAAFSGSPYHSAVAKVDTRALALEAGNQADQVKPAELADWIVKGNNNFLLVDLRTPEAYATYHIPGAVNIPLTQLTPDFARRNERIIFCSDNDVQAAQAWFLIRAQKFPAVYMLSGGIEAWKNTVLFPMAPAENASPADQVEFARRAAVAKFFGGAPRGASAGPAAAELPKLTPPPAPAAEIPTQTSHRKKREGC